MTKEMKRNVFLLSLALGMGALLSSCSSEAPVDDETTGRKGKVTLRLEPTVTFVTATRAVDESSYQSFGDYSVSIDDNKGNNKFSGTYAELQTRMPMELPIGSYTISAEYGTEHASSRDAFLVKGEDAFTISGDQTTAVTVNCTPTSGKLLVQFDAAMATYYDDYNVDFTGTAALGTSVAHWAKGDAAPYYIALNQSGETVSYTIYLTAKSDYATEKEGQKIVNATVTGSFDLARNETKILKVQPNYTATTDGGLSIVITIDDTTNDKPITIEVPVTWI